MSENLNIMAWNANGLLKHRDELQVILDVRDIDVCLVSETHFTTKSRIYFEGYKVYKSCSPKNTGKGGSAIIIKENVDHSIGIEYEGDNKQSMQIVKVSIKTDTNEITVASIYFSPKYTKVDDLLITMPKVFEFLGPIFILGGDFNAKHTAWGSLCINTRGNHLLRTMNSNDCKAVSTRKPTHWPSNINKIPDLVDFFICKDISLECLSIEETFDLSSDHSPLILTFRHHILLKSSLMSSLCSDDNNNNAWPKEILALMSEKCSQRQKWQCSRSLDDKVKLDEITNKFRRDVKLYLEERKRKSIDDIAHFLENTCTIL